MLFWVIIALAVPVPIQGRLYNNPILGEGNFSDPGAIKMNGSYYIVTSTNDSLSAKFPIYMSTDLTSWKLTGHIFTECNIPRWSDLLQPFLSPRIHKIGSNYHVYFTAVDSSTNKFSIGVAVAPQPEGPYTATDRPLLSDPAEHLTDASIINDNDDLYLIWATSNAIRGRMLNSNGLSFYATYSTELISREPQVTSLGGPWYIRRESYHYLIYSQNDFSNQTLYAARSSYPLGPYSQRNSPILASNNDFKGHGSLVKGLDDQSDLLVFHALRKGEVGSAWPRVTLLASVRWNNEEYSYENRDWPIIYDY